MPFGKMKILMINNEELKLNNNTLDLEEKSSPSPWNPYVPALIAFAIGIGGGAVVTYINLRRCGKGKKETIILSLGVVILSFIIAFVPAYTYFVLSIKYAVIAAIFYVAQKSAFIAWQHYHQEADPNKWWRAIGWGFLGLAIHFLIIIALSIFNITTGPQPRNLQPLR